MDGGDKSSKDAAKPTKGKSRIMSIFRSNSSSCDPAVYSTSMNNPNTSQSDSMLCTSDSSLPYSDKSNIEDIFPDQQRGPKHIDDHPVKEIKEDDDDIRVPEEEVGDKPKERIRKIASVSSRVSFKNFILNEDGDEVNIEEELDEDSDDVDVGEISVSSQEIDKNRKLVQTSSEQSTNSEMSTPDEVSDSKLADQANMSVTKTESVASIDSHVGSSCTLNSVSGTDEVETSITEGKDNSRLMMNAVTRCNTLRNITKNNHKDTRKPIIKESNLSELTSTLNAANKKATIESLSQSRESDQKSSRESIIKDFLTSETIHVDFIRQLSGMASACAATSTTATIGMNLNDAKKLFVAMKEICEFYNRNFDSLQASVANKTFTCGQYFLEMTNYLTYYIERIQISELIPDIIKKYSNNELFKSTIGRPTKVKGTNEFINLIDLLGKPTTRLIDYGYFLNCLSIHSSDDSNENKNLETSSKIFQVFMENLPLVAHKKNKNSLARQVVASFSVVQINSEARRVRHLFLLNDVFVCGSVNKKGETVIKWHLPYNYIIQIHPCLITEDELPPNPELAKSLGNIMYYRSQLKLLQESKPGSKKCSKTLKLSKVLTEEELNYFVHSCQYKVTLVQKSSKEILFWFNSRNGADEFSDHMNVRIMCKFLHQPEIAQSELISLINDKLKGDTESNNLLEEMIEDENKFEGFIQVRIVCTYRTYGSTNDITIEYLINHHDQFFSMAKTKPFKPNEMIDFKNLAYIKSTNKFKFRILSKSDNLLFEDVQDFDLKVLEKWKYNRFFFNTCEGHFVAMCLFSEVSDESSFKTPTFYGTSVTEISRIDNSTIPLTVKVCYDANLEYGSQIRGIYRLSPVKKHLDYWTEIVKDGLLVNKVQWENVDINISAAIVKQFFREMAKPIAGASVIKQLENWCNNHRTNHEMLVNILSNLSVEEYATLLYTLEHIKQMCKYTEVTSMGSENLNLLFSPNLFRICDQKILTDLYSNYCSHRELFDQVTPVNIPEDSLNQS